MKNRFVVIFSIPTREVFRFAFLIGFCLAAEALQAQTQSAIKGVDLSAPRPYGYSIGDRISHTLSIDVQHEYKLLSDLLPNPGRLNDWLELRDITVNDQIRGSRNHYRIALTYQFFKGTKEANDETIPGLTLHFSNGKQEIQASTPDWRFSYSPLIPAGTPDTAVPIRPALSPEPIPLDGPVRILALLLTGVLALSGYLAWRCGILPFSARRNGPFDRACRDLKQLRSKPTDVKTYQAGLRIVHRAINESAGNTIFGGHIEQLYRANPSFIVLREQLERFFEESQDAFFATGVTDEPRSLRWLENLCRRHRVIERQHR